MNGRETSRAATPELLAKLSRFEALFELAGVINQSNDIEAIGAAVARRLKFIVDVQAWRYLCLDGDLDGDLDGRDGRSSTVVIVDGHRGQAEVIRTHPGAMSDYERDLWREGRMRVLCGEPLREALKYLPDHLRRDDLEQIAVHALVNDGNMEALLLYAKRRLPFTELDMKCLAMVGDFFHRKVHMLWEGQKLRDLEVAYLEQEAMLRQTEKLATLGRLSAGMAHELNNPSAAARRAAEQLKGAVQRLEHSRFELGAAGLSDEQRQLVAELELEAEESAGQPSVLDPLTRSDLEQQVEAWLEENGVEEPWSHAATLVAMGFHAEELEELISSFSTDHKPLVIDYFCSRCAVCTLLEEIGHGARRVEKIIKALKSYSYMDRAPVQAVDVREGLRDTLMMLSGKLSGGIEVQLDLADGLPHIQAYGSELNQVWTNLIDNALGAMEGSGALELRAYQRDDRVVVEIADNGPGIPLENQDKIFDPFFTTKAPGEGAGLGLNLSHGIIVRKHRGRIWVESEPGATRFSVELPIAGMPDAAG